MPQTAQMQMLPAGFSPLASPWGFPSPPPQMLPAMFQYMQHQWGMPSHMHPYASPSASISPGLAAFRQPEPSTSTFHGTIDTADAVGAWCQQHDLGEDETQCLRKLGFKVGDDLEELSDDMWKFAGVLPLCRMHIIRAYRSSKEVNATI